MRLIRFALFLLFALVAVQPAPAQSSESYRGMLTARVRADKLPPPQHLKDYVQGGKLSLGLRDAILLTLENNSNVQIDETQIEAQKFTLLGQFQPFDPVLQSSLNINRYSSPSYSQLQGVGVSGNGTLNSLSQIGQVSYTQTFSPGTNIVASYLQQQILHQQLLLLLQSLLQFHVELHHHPAVVARRRTFC